MHQLRLRCEPDRLPGSERAGGRLAVVHAATALAASAAALAAVAAAAAATVLTLPHWYFYELTPGRLHLWRTVITKGAAGYELARSV